jgi:phospholipase A1
MTIAAVFVPGIMGSELVRPGGEVVWPPKVSETVLGYKRIAALQDPAARATRIISNVSCVDFYAPIQSLFAQLDFSVSGAKRLVEHPYDWRLDLFDLAEGLAQRLDHVAADEIVLVAHSMGGLITRLMLETPTWRDRPWFGKINRFIALATPHNGAPLALARIMGLDSALGISAQDFVTLSSNPAYPSGYQLLPAPGEDACWDTRRNSALAPLDFYNHIIAAQLGLKPALVDRAKALHDALHAGFPPSHVRYFYFSGAGHKTVTRVNVDASGAQKVETPDAGDGTVPMWSAFPRLGQKHTVINEHANVFRGDPFKRVFFRLMGDDAGVPTEAPEGAQFQLAISLQKPVFAEGQPIEVVLSSESSISTLEGRLVFESRTSDDEALADVATVLVSYAGPGIYTLAMTMDLTLAPGLYELRFEGDRQQTERIVFAISRTI